jgi:ribosomal protein S18 acetylase RimI-like enzyme
LFRKTLTAEYRISVVGSKKTEKDVTKQGEFQMAIDMLTISTMTMEDYEEAFALWTRTAGMGLRSLDDSPQGIQSFLQRNLHTNFVCRIDGVLAGVILSGHDGRRGYIYHAVVDGQHRRQGIGKQMVLRVIDALKGEGIKKAALVVYADNQKGNAFWESMGFLTRQDLHYRNLSLDPANR